MPVLHPPSLRAGFFILMLPAAMSCHAMGGLMLLDPVPKDESTLAIGASAWSLPRDPGASRQRLWLLPGIDYYHPSGLFVSTDYGIGWNGSQRDDVQMGLRIAPYFGRSLHQALAAGDVASAIGTRLERSAFLNVAPNSALLLQSSLRTGLGRHGDGALLEAGATSGIPLPGGELIGATVGLSWANGAYRSSYHGVPRAGSLAPAAITPGSGLQDVQAALSYEHRFNEVWRIDSQLLGARLLGAAAASPLTRARYQRALTVSLWRDLR